MKNERRPHTQSKAKERNKKAIIKALWQNHPNSRTGLARATNLNKATITNLVSELEREEIILEVGRQNVVIGREPTLIMLNKSYGLCAGVALSPIGAVTVAISSIYAEIIWEKSQSFDIDLFSLDLFVLISEMLGEGIAACKHISEKLLGIGVSIPGLSRHRADEMFDLHQGEWVNVPITDFLKKRFGVPVFVDTVIHNALIAEYWFGVAKNYSDTIMLFIGYGIGASMIINGSLYQSASELPGDAGHMSFDPNGLYCRCGNRGCWELNASFLYLNGEDPMDVVQKADSGDGEAISTLDIIGRNLGFGIVNIINMFNPQAVILSGDIIQCGKWVMNPCEIVLQRNLKPLVRESFDLKYSEMGRKAALIGALTRVIEQLFV